MRRIGLAVLLALSFFVAPLFVEAQETPRVWRIGFLGAGLRSSADPRVEAIRRGFQELGYIEGRNLALEFRWAGGNADRLPALAAELARVKVDAIATQGTQATDAARRAVTSIPIVFAVAGDPVGTGLVASLARPGGNVTGLTDIAPENRRKASRVAPRGSARDRSDCRSLESGKPVGGAPNEGHGRRGPLPRALRSISRSARQ